MDRCKVKLVLVLTLMVLLLSLSSLGLLRALVSSSYMTTGKRGGLCMSVVVTLLLLFIPRPRGGVSEKKAHIP
jgi:hypothetical protein